MRDVPVLRPDRKIAFQVTITNLSTPIQQYEQAGITWYHDARPVFKLVKELVDGQLMIIPGRAAVASETVQLRLVVSGRDYEAQFRPDAKGEFKVVATGQLPEGGKHQVSMARLIFEEAQVSLIDRTFTFRRVRSFKPFIFLKLNHFQERVRDCLQDHKNPSLFGLYYGRSACAWVYI